MRYRFDDFVLDLETAELRRDGEVVPLRRQTFRLLQLLVENARVLQRRDDIMDRLWGHDALSPNALPQAISELRRALGDQPEAPRYIETRRGTGYLFIAEVNSEPPQASGASTAATGSPSVAAVKSRDRYLLGVAALLLIVVTLTAAAMLWPERDLPSNRAVVQPRLTPLSLALAPLPAAAHIPEWVPYAALELLGQQLQSERLRIYRGEALGLDYAAGPARWQHQARDLLGASHTLTGRWDQREPGGLVLNFSVLELPTGRVLTSESVSGQADELEQLIAEASAIVREALAIPQQAVTGEHVMQPAQRSQYLAALAALARGDAAAAVEPLQQLHQQLLDPAWLEVDLARALAGNNQRQAAIALLDTRLARTAELPLGERLRLQAELARLRYQPSAAAAALRALVEIYPTDVDAWVALVEQELDALQGDSARATLARLEQLLSTRADPRVGLLKSRMARIDGDYASSAALLSGVVDQAERHELPDLAVDAAMSQAKNLEAQGQVAEAQALLAQAEERWSKRMGDGRSFELRLERLRLLRIQGELKAARGLLPGLEQATDPMVRAQIAVQTALLETYSGQHQTADEVLDRIEPLIVEIDNPPLQVALLDARGYVALARNDVDRSQRSFAEAFHLARQTGLERQSVALMVNAGRLLARQRRLTEADELWQQALTIFIKLGDRRGQATVLGNLAALASMQGQSERADELNQRALALFRELALSGPQARTAYNLALSAARDGRLADADQLYAEAAEVWLREAQVELAIRAVVGRVDMVLLMADIASAERYLGLIPTQTEISALGRSHLRTGSAQVALYRGQLGAAREGHTDALRLRLEAGEADWAALSELELARLDLLTGSDPADVQVRAEILRDAFVQTKEIRDEARAALLVAESALIVSQPDAAGKALSQARAALERFHDQTLAMDLDWLSIWLEPEATRRTYLSAYRQRAQSTGFKRHALQADLALGDRELLDSLAPFQLPEMGYVGR